MITTRPTFRGYPEFLEAAVAESGANPASEADARRQPALSHVASLVAAMSEQGTPHHDTHRRARELVEGLKLAHQAAAAMLATVTPEVEVETSVEPEKAENDDDERQARIAPEGQTDRPARRPDGGRRK